MKNFFTLIFCAVVSLNILAQEKVLISQPFENLKTISTLTLNAPNLEQIHQEDDAREKNGELYRIGATIATNINPNSSGTWTSYNDGSRTWNLRVKSTGAEALSFLFSDFQLF
jgi:hypothetical protein